MEVPFNSLDIGKHVWLETGLTDHGPAGGPKTSVPGKNLGTVVATEKPYMTMDFLLYAVRWSSGHLTKHYYNELLCIGDFVSLAEFYDAVANCSEATLFVGPKGGFRRFTALVIVGTDVRNITYFKEQGMFFRQVIAPILEKAGIPIRTETVH